MVLIRIICMGRLREEWKAVQEEFMKRIGKFCRAEIIEMRKGEREVVKRMLVREKERGARLIVLDERGGQLTSREFAGLVEKNNYLVFFIGGKEGMEEEIRKMGDLVLSLSSLTFSHQLARIILLEQIYRAFCILHHHPYASE